MSEHPYLTRPIGFIRSSLVDLHDAPRQGDEGAPAAWLDFLPAVSDALLGIRVGDELIVLTWLHRSSRDVLQVHPRGDGEAPLAGVFATRSPHRPNPVGIHRVSVLEVSGQRLKVAPMEAIHGTPIIDVKPVLSPARDRIRPDSITLRAATMDDVAKVTGLVNDAYGHYVDRLGMYPRPMTDNYAEVIQKSRVTVAESHGMLLGVLVLDITQEGFVVDNIAVHPTCRGRGLGRILLEFAEAEARRAGFGSIYLYTHEKMIVNQAIYSRMGYVQYDRRSMGSFSLIYMRKYL